jgi:hypothetical protein
MGVFDIRNTGELIMISLGELAAFALIVLLLAACLLFVTCTMSRSTKMVCNTLAQHTKAQMLTQETEIARLKANEKLVNKVYYALVKNAWRIEGDEFIVLLQDPARTYRIKCSLRYIPYLYRAYREGTIIPFIVDQTCGYIIPYFPMLRQQASQKSPSVSYKQPISSSS